MYPRGSFYKRLLFTFLLVGLLSLFDSELEAQTIYTNTAKAKYVKTSNDTFIVTTGGFVQSTVSGFVTNESATKQLYVYFAKSTGAIDTGTRILIEPGKTLHFRNIKTAKIYRVAVSDSAFSQIIIGDVQLNSNDNPEIRNYEYAVYHSDNDFRKPERYRMRKNIPVISS